MQFKRYAGVIIACCMLLSCASTRMAQELQGGKYAFESGYYQEAFHRLLPLAVKGKAEAQYAVGYMYYYGYGAPEDTESGIFWMTKAAEQNYAPAIKALDLIHQHDAKERYENARDNRRNERLQYTPVVVPPKTKRVSFNEEPHPEPAVKIATAAEEKAELNIPPVQPTRHYALQLFGSYHLDSVKELQLQLRLKNTGHVYRTTHQGKDWYVLTFGNFATAHEASATQNNLPTSLKELRPWVRKVDALGVV